MRAIGRGTDLAPQISVMRAGGGASEAARPASDRQRGSGIMDLGEFGRRLWTDLRIRLRRGQPASRPSASRVARPDPRQTAEWTRRIEEAGIAPEWAARLAPSLAESQRELGRGTSPALIRGAALAMAVQLETQAEVERNLRDVREVERLLGAFTGELAKLDEVLEVLSAYAQRMRPQKPTGTPPRMLH